MPKPQAPRPAAPAPEALVVKTGASPARVAAILALMAIESEGRWANAELPSSTGRLSDQDRALATALVAGVTRRRLALDHALNAYLSKPMSALPPGVRNALRLGLFQLRHQDRTPPHAAVDEAVRLARAFGHEGLARLANGVLRTAQREPNKGAPPSLEANPVGHLVAAEGLPLWIAERWVKAYGAADALALARHANQEAPLTLRPNPLKGGSGPALAKALAEAQVEAKPHAVLGQAAICLPSVGAVTALPGYLEGLWAVQDAAAIAVGLALGVKPGEKVADVGAAPGGKTAHLAALMQNQGELVAVETNESRIERLKENLQRLGADAFVRIAIHDGRKLAELGPFDRILVDAPCSGLGVLARKPDLRHRRKLSEIAELAVLQNELLDGAAKALKPGGVLVYATCTIAPEENEEVVRAFLSRHPGYRLEALAEALPTAWAADVVEGGMMQWWPPRHASDGFFVARLVAPQEGT